MRVIALIDDPGVVRRILEHPGRWAPEPAERSRPAHIHPAGAVLFVLLLGQLSGARWAKYDA